MNKYWENVSEQSKAKGILDSFFEIRRVPHAFIFYGPDGIGKFNTAIQYCKVLYAQFSDEIKNNALKKISNLQEPYLKYIFPMPRGKGESGDDSSVDKLTKDQLNSIQAEIHNKTSNPYYKIELENANTIKISNIREIKKFMATTYDEIPNRYIIIEDAHLMNEQSQNALLKSLEEPPVGVFFFLITSQKDKLLTTIQSRCWHIDFEPLTNIEIEKILVDYFKFNNEKAKKVALFSEGSVQSAIKLSNSNLDDILVNVISILRYSLAKRYYSAIKELNNSLINQSTEDLKLIIKLIKIWLNDVVKNRFSLTNYYYQEFIETLEKFNQKFTDVNINLLYDRLSFLEESCDRNLNLNVLALNLIFEIGALTIRK
jgi:DNA polymerase-3 subunit delta'